MSSNKRPIKNGSKSPGDRGKPLSHQIGESTRVDHISGDQEEKSDLSY